MFNTILEIVLALHGAAILIVNLTPTPLDNTVVGYLYKGLEILAGIVTDKAKSLPGEDL